MKRYFLMAIILCWHAVAMATIATQINQSKVQLGEMFRLTLTIDDPQDGGIPDLTPLEPNFTIVGTERSTAYSIVNGQTSSVHQWIVLLTAKKTGMLLIPAIQIGHQESTATSIEVTNSQTAITPDDQQGITQDEVMLRASVSKLKPYVNQQVIYTVKLYNSQRLLDAEYQPPRIEDALLVPLGDGRRYQTTLNGQHYAVEEQQYAIFPQKSGDLKIIGPSFNALVFDTVPKRIRVGGKTTKLAVKLIPANCSGKYWLPASQVALTEVYDQTGTTMREGSTLSRTVTMQAAGVPAQLLPALEFANSSQYNTYTEKPDHRNTARQQDLVGRADIKVTYILNKSGQITIPAINVPWFNTVTGKEEIASLPARTIEIEALRGASQPKMTESLSASKNQDVVTPPQPLPTLTADAASVSLAWWLAGGFALAWVITLVLWGSRKGNLGKSRSKRLALKKLHKACASHNPSQAQVALMHWATLQWPDSELLNLHQLGKLVHDSLLKKQLSLLSQALYSQEGNTQWRGDALWRSVTEHLQSKPAPKGKGSGLPPINPF